jgi:hypothetical protein
MSLITLWAVHLWLNILGHPVPALMFVETREECRSVRSELHSTPLDDIRYDISVPRCLYLGVVVSHSTSYKYNIEIEREAVWYNPYWRGY